MDLSRPMPSVEEGNAYRTESWLHGRSNALQNQVCAMYESIAANTHLRSEALMDETLAANFCPFPSPSWAKLENPSETIAYCSELWSQILRSVRPRVIICLGNITAKYVSELFVREGFDLVSKTKFASGWGSISCEASTFLKDDYSVRLVRVPHLSRFKIFREQQSAELVRLTDQIGDRLTTPDFILNEDLRLSDLPGPSAPWQEIGEFALTFDGCGLCDSLVTLAAEADSSIEPSITAFRAKLFQEQRSWRHSDLIPDGEQLAHIRGLVESIRRLVLSEKLPEPKITSPKTKNHGSRLRRRF
jgi:hypothetical protein